MSVSTVRRAPDGAMDQRRSSGLILVVARRTVEPCCRPLIWRSFRVVWWDFGNRETNSPDKRSPPPARTGPPLVRLGGCPLGVPFAPPPSPRALSPSRVPPGSRRHGLRSRGRTAGALPPPRAPRPARDRPVVRSRPRASRGASRGQTLSLLPSTLAARRTPLGARFGRDTPRFLGAPLARHGDARERERAQPQPGARPAPAPARDRAPPPSARARARAARPTYPIHFRAFSRRFPRRPSGPPPSSHATERTPIYSPRPPAPRPTPPRSSSRSPRW